MKPETKLSIIAVVILLCVAYFSAPLVLNAIDHELDKNDATAVRHNTTLKRQACAVRFSSS